MILLYICEFCVNLQWELLLVMYREHMKLKSALVNSVLYIIKYSICIIFLQNFIKNIYFLR